MSNWKPKKLCSNKVLRSTLRKILWCKSFLIERCDEGNDRQDGYLNEELLAYCQTNSSRRWIDDQRKRDHLFKIRHTCIVAPINRVIFLGMSLNGGKTLGGKRNQKNNKHCFYICRSCNVNLLFEIYLAVPQFVGVQRIFFYHFCPQQQLTEWSDQ